MWQIERVLHLAMAEDATEIISGVFQAHEVWEVAACGLFEYSIIKEGLGFYNVLRTSPYGHRESVLVSVSWNDSS